MKLLNFIRPRLVVFMLVTACFPWPAGIQAAAPPNAIQIMAFAPAQPVLEGSISNPFMCIRITVSGKENVGVERISVKANSAVLTCIKAINLYLQGTEGFNPSQSIATIVPRNENLDISIALTLKPGVHVVWFGVTLLPGTPPGTRLSLLPLSISSSRRSIPITDAKGQFSKYTGVVLRKAGADGVNTYRIPGIVKTDKGTLIAVYDIRYQNDRDLPGDIDVGMSRSTDKGVNWESMKIIMDMGEPQATNGIGDPAVLFDPVTRKIWVVALWSKGNRSIAGSLPGISPDSTGQFMAVYSADDGLSWSKPVSLTPQVKDPGWHLFFQGPGSGIAMQNGTLVFAAQYWDETKKPWSTIIYSTDHGTTWTGKLKGPRINTTESQVVETTPGTLMLNMRDNRGSFRAVSVTNDLGVHWTDHSSSYFALTDPVCMGSLVKMTIPVNSKKKTLLFFANPDTRSGRFNMTIKASPDLGETWPEKSRYLLDERLGYGYSSLVQVDDKTIGILYEGIKELYFVAIPVSAILK